MKPYLLYIIGLVVMPLAMVLCLMAHLPFTALAAALILAALCGAIHGRISRLLYAYRETEAENQRLHDKLAEAERQAQYLRQLTENVDTALFVCTTDGRIDWMNHAAAPLLSPQGGRDLLPPNILHAIASHEDVVDGCALSTTLLRIDGQRRLVVALKDVSMLMQRQEMEAWQQLIRVLTHEIMNSLTPIVSISETMMEEEAFAVINRRCRALLDFVESYRQLTRIKAPQRTRFPLSELLGDIQKLYPQVRIQQFPLPLLEGSSVSSSRAGGGREGASLYADRSQLEQVLINLITNAFESGATEVELYADSTSLSVRDNGCGMTPDVLSHIFVPFFTTKPAGTGIGLSLCRQILLQHGGTIAARSVPGLGTTFTITLPQNAS